MEISADDIDIGDSVGINGPNKHDEVYDELIAAAEETSCTSNMFEYTSRDSDVETSTASESPGDSELSHGSEHNTESSQINAAPENIARYVGLELLNSGWLCANAQLLHLCEVGKLSIYGPYISSDEDLDIHPEDRCPSIFHAAARTVGFSFDLGGNLMVDTVAMSVLQRLEEFSRASKVHRERLRTITKDCNELRKLLINYFDLVLVHQVYQVVCNYCLANIREQAASSVGEAVEPYIYNYASSTYARNIAGATQQSSDESLIKEPARTSSDTFMEPFESLEKHIATALDERVTALCGYIALDIMQHTSFLQTRDENLLPVYSVTEITERYDYALRKIEEGSESATPNWKSLLDLWERHLLEEAHRAGPKFNHGTPCLQFPMDLKFIVLCPAGEIASFWPQKQIPTHLMHIHNSTDTVATALYEISYTEVLRTLHYQTSPHRMAPTKTEATSTLELFSSQPRQFSLSDLNEIIQRKPTSRKKHPRDIQGHPIFASEASMSDIEKMFKDFESLAISTEFASSGGGQKRQPFGNHYERHRWTSENNSSSYIHSPSVLGTLTTPFSVIVRLQRGPVDIDELKFANTLVRQTQLLLKTKLEAMETYILSVASPIPNLAKMEAFKILYRCFVRLSTVA
jgi:hypothetical protein